MDFNFYSRLESGHRIEYIDFCEKKLNGRRCSLLTAMFTRKPVLFLMVEEGFVMYFLVSLLRSLFLRRTSGLVFRGVDVLKSGIMKSGVKKNAMGFTRRIKFINNISIVPFYVEPELESICDEWIYDFQFWDRDVLCKSVGGVACIDLERRIREAANGRKILSAIGKQDKSKGFDSFIALYLSSEKLREKYLFVAAGKVSGFDETQILKFTNSGGLVIDKKISSAELVAMYKVTDVVWAAYSPEYDQSSGVFGRALQYENFVIVRAGSVISKIVKKVKSSYLEVQLEEYDVTVENLLGFNFVVNDELMLINDQNKLVDIVSGDF
ncbi:hypothetical protein M0C34_18935 [Agarivorans sp. TSD2052]|uniref:hypothetical protein n=1 Tax=Agarivorans sp. TSD2052 TaxID=2937286 RepID=UPI00200E3887|nr:hypothetical protein [Agarivorans sp. TSD2052]UPW18273.1 hypothetical protein M0C34_18935 [Agarivorans sp. TSD2052]